MCISTETVRHNGHIKVSAIIIDLKAEDHVLRKRLHTRVYMGYTKAEAIAEFREDIKGEGLILAKD